MHVDGIELPPGLIQRLERLSLSSRHSRKGGGAGPRRSPAAGRSVEFSDYRSYAPGDDFRRVDWNAYARLDRLFMRVFEAEQNTCVTLFLDSSKSMAGGEPGKIQCAKTIAAAIAYIALANYDRVSVVSFSDRLGSYLPARVGRGAAIDIWRFIGNLPVGGATRFECLRTFRGLRPLPGLAVILSDFLTDTDWRGSLANLQVACKQEVTALQILAPQELHPDIQGEWALSDVETGHTVDISASRSTIDRYRAAERAHSKALAGWCHANEMAYAQISSDANIEDIIFRLLTRVGVAQ